LKANILYPSLNSCGGGERLAIVTMQAVLESGIDFELTTFERPDINRIQKAFGQQMTSTVKKAKRVNILESFEQGIKESEKDYPYNLTINAHADSIPYYHPCFAKNNAVTYCHFPTAKSHIMSENIAYLRELRFKGDIRSIDKTYTISPRPYDDIKKKKKAFRMLNTIYDKMMKNTVVLTNSEFSRQAIFKSAGVDALIVPPPVDIGAFHKSRMTSCKERNNTILVTSRIDPNKKIENAILLAKLLKAKHIAQAIIIVGSLCHENLQYYSSLKQRVEDLDLADFVRFEPTASFERLLELMSKSKAYFHPLPEEPFGISIVEAMSAGLIPIVPDVGGQTEFVPPKYHYHTLEDASQVVSLALSALNLERKSVSSSIKQFSASNYIRNFRQIMDRLSSWEGP
jgi:glycosyltransferase involved in cell wall biosynthesis